MGQKWTEKKEDGYRLIQNENGQELGISEDSRAKILTVDGYAFKDLAGTRELLPYEDWRLSYEERAKAVSYTHLDVYKRQAYVPARMSELSDPGNLQCH